MDIPTHWKRWDEFSKSHVNVFVRLNRKRSKSYNNPVAADTLPVFCNLRKMFSSPFSVTDVTEIQQCPLKKQKNRRGGWLGGIA
jgi:hypothetical protein